MILLSFLENWKLAVNSGSENSARKPGQISVSHGIDIVLAKNNLKTVGFAYFEGLLSQQLLSSLRAEAANRQKDAVQVCGKSECLYQAHLAGLGEAGVEFLSGDGMSSLLCELFGLPFIIEEGASCYTYYQPGDSLGPHLDHPEQCMVTVILYLDVIRPKVRADRTGLELHIFGADPSFECWPRLILPTKAGSLVIGLGSKHWHKRPTMQNGEYLTALTACYSRAIPA